MVFKYAVMKSTALDTFNFACMLHDFLENEKNAFGVEA